MSPERGAPGAAYQGFEGSDPTTGIHHGASGGVTPIVRVSDARRVEHWRACALVALDRLARAGRPFTASDVTAAVGAPCPSSVLLGGLLAAAHRRGQLVLVGATVDVRARGTVAPTRLWAGAPTTTSSAA